MNLTNLNIIEDLLKNQGVELFGWTKLIRPISIDLFKNWLDEKKHLDMSYLESGFDLRKNPELIPLNKDDKKINGDGSTELKARSALVMAIPYVPPPWEDNVKSKISYNRVALYSKGNDYHDEIPKLLEPILNELHRLFPNEVFKAFTDSAPVLERDLAYRAGLGWIGKNTCLLNRKKGSLFFIAEVYTSIEFNRANPWSADFCGSCDRCITSCPTQALSKNKRELDPQKCISYWTIESKSIPPLELRTQIGDWLFGCDICQTVCPWNQKILVNHLVESNLDSNLESNLKHDNFSQLFPMQSNLSERAEELSWILRSSRKELARFFKNSPFSRAAGWKLQRNAIIVAVNLNLKQLLPDIERFELDDKLGELVVWAKSKL